MNLTQEQLEQLKPKSDEVLLFHKTRKVFQKMKKRIFKHATPSARLGDDAPVDYDGWIVSDWDNLAAKIDKSEDPPEVKPTKANTKAGAKTTKASATAKTAETKANAEAGEGAQTPNE